MTELGDPRRRDPELARLELTDEQRASLAVGGCEGGTFVGSYD